MAALKWSDIRSLLNSVETNTTSESGIGGPSSSSSSHSTQLSNSNPSSSSTSSRKRKKRGSQRTSSSTGVSDTNDDSESRGQLSGGSLLTVCDWCMNELCTEPSKRSCTKIDNLFQVFSVSVRLLSDHTCNVWTIQPQTLDDDHPSLPPDPGGARASHSSQSAKKKAGFRRGIITHSSKPGSSSSSNVTLQTWIIGQLVSSVHVMFVGGLRLILSSMLLGLSLDSLGSTSNPSSSETAASLMSDTRRAIDRGLQELCSFDSPHSTPLLCAMLSDLCRLWSDLLTVDEVWHDLCRDGSSILALADASAARIQLRTLRGWFWISHCFAHSMHRIRERSHRQINDDDSKKDHSSDDLSLPKNIVENPSVWIDWSKICESVRCFDQSECYPSSILDDSLSLNLDIDLRIWHRCREQVRRTVVDLICSLCHKVSADQLCLVAPEVMDQLQCLIACEFCPKTGEYPLSEFRVWQQSNVIFHRNQLENVTKHTRRFIPKEFCDCFYSLFQGIDEEQRCAHRHSSLDPPLTVTFEEFQSEIAIISDFDTDLVFSVLRLFNSLTSNVLSSQECRGLSLLKHCVVYLYAMISLDNCLARTPQMDNVIADILSRVQRLIDFRESADLQIRSVVDTEFSDNRNKRYSKLDLDGKREGSGWVSRWTVGWIHGVPQLLKSTCSIRLKTVLSQMICRVFYVYPKAQPSFLHALTSILRAPMPIPGSSMIDGDIKMGVSTDHSTSALLSCILYQMIMTSTTVAMRFLIVETDALLKHDCLDSDTQRLLEALECILRDGTVSDGRIPPPINRSGRWFIGCHSKEHSLVMLEQLWPILHGLLRDISELKTTLKKKSKNQSKHSKRDSSDCFVRGLSEIHEHWCHLDFALRIWLILPQKYSFYFEGCSLVPSVDSLGRMDVDDSTVVRGRHGDQDQKGDEELEDSNLALLRRNSLDVRDWLLCRLYSFVKRLCESYQSCLSNSNTKKSSKKKSEHWIIAEEITPRSLAMLMRSVLKSVAFFCSQGLIALSALKQPRKDKKEGLTGSSSALSSSFSSSSDSTLSSVMMQMVLILTEDIESCPLNVMNDAFLVVACLRLDTRQLTEMIPRLFQGVFNVSHPLSRDTIDYQTQFTRAIPLLCAKLEAETDDIRRNDLRVVIDCLEKQLRQCSDRFQAYFSLEKSNKNDERQQWRLKSTVSFAELECSVRVMTALIRCLSQCSCVYCHSGDSSLASDFFPFDLSAILMPQSLFGGDFDRSVIQLKRGDSTQRRKPHFKPWFDASYILQKYSDGWAAILARFIKLSDEPSLMFRSEGDSGVRSFRCPTCEFTSIMRSKSGRQLLRDPSLKDESDWIDRFPKQIFRSVSRSEKYIKLYSRMMDEMREKLSFARNMTAYRMALSELTLAQLRCLRHMNTIVSSSSFQMGRSSTKKTRKKKLSDGSNVGESEKKKEKEDWLSKYVKELISHPSSAVQSVVANRFDIIVDYLCVSGQTKTECPLTVVFKSDQNNDNDNISDNNNKDESDDAKSHSDSSLMVSPIKSEAAKIEHIQKQHNLAMKSCIQNVIEYLKLTKQSKVAISNRAAIMRCLSVLVDPEIEWLCLRYILELYTQHQKYRPRIRQQMLMLVSDSPFDSIEQLLLSHSRRMAESLCVSLVNLPCMANRVCLDFLRTSPVSFLKWHCPVLLPQFITLGQRDVIEAMEIFLDVPKSRLISARHRHRVLCQLLIESIRNRSLRSLFFFADILDDSSKTKKKKSTLITASQSCSSASSSSSSSSSRSAAATPSSVVSNQSTQQLSTLTDDTDNHDKEEESKKRFFRMIQAQRKTEVLLLHELFKHAGVSDNYQRNLAQAAISLYCEMAFYSSVISNGECAVSDAVSSLQAMMLGTLKRSHRDRSKETTANTLARHASDLFYQCSKVLSHSKKSKRRRSSGGGSTGTHGAANGANGGGGSGLVSASVSPATAIAPLPSALMISSKHDQNQQPVPPPSSSSLSSSMNKGNTCSSSSVSAMTSGAGSNNNSVSPSSTMTNQSNDESQKRKTLRSIRVLMKLLGPFLDKHVTSVVNLLHSALQTRSMIDEALDAWSEFLRSLSNKSLSQHLTRIVVTLLNFVEVRNPALLLAETSDVMINNCDGRSNVGGVVTAVVGSSSEFGMSSEVHMFDGMATQLPREGSVQIAGALTQAHSLMPKTPDSGRGSHRRKGHSSSHISALSSSVSDGNDMISGGSRAGYTQIDAGLDISMMHPSLALTQAAPMMKSRVTMDGDNDTAAMMGSGYENSKINEKIAVLLDYIIIVKRSCTERNWNELPLLPELPEFRGLQAKLERARGRNETVQSKINDVINLLRSSGDSSHVRRMALTTLHYVLENSRPALERSLAEDGGNEALLRRLMSELLKVCNDRDPEVVQLCAQCIGSVGVIDWDDNKAMGVDHRINTDESSLNTSDFTNNTSNISSSSEGNSNSGAGHGYSMMPPPQKFDRKELIAHLIAEHLVPLLRVPDSTSLEHSVRYCIQELLKLVGCSPATVAELERFKSKKQKGSSSSSSSKIRSVDKIGKGAKFVLDFPDDIQSVIHPCLDSCLRVKPAGPASTSSSVNVACADTASAAAFAAAADGSAMMSKHQNENPIVIDLSEDTPPPPSVNGSGVGIPLVDQKECSCFESLFRQCLDGKMHRFTLGAWLDCVCPTLTRRVRERVKRRSPRGHRPSTDLTKEDVIMFETLDVISQQRKKFAMVILPYLFDALVSFPSEHESLLLEISDVISAVINPDSLIAKIETVMSEGGLSDPDPHPSAATINSSSIVGPLSSSSNAGDIFSSVRPTLTPSERRKIVDSFLIQCQLCAQRIFETIDAVMYWRASFEPRLQSMLCNVESSSVRIEWMQRCSIGRSFLDSLPYLDLAKAASECRSHARALRYFELGIRSKKKHERIDYSQGRHLPLSLISCGELETGESRVWQRILNDQRDRDQMGCVSLFCVEFSQMDVAMDFEAQGRWDRAYQTYEHCLHTERDNLTAQQGYLRCLLRMGHLRSMSSFVESQMRSGGHRERMLEFGMDACWRLGEWDQVDGLLAKRGASSVASSRSSSSRSSIGGSNVSFSCQLGETLSRLHHMGGGKALSDHRDGLAKSTELEMMLNQIRLTVVRKLGSARTTSVTALYPMIVQLHMLSEVSALLTHISLPNGEDMVSHFSPQRRHGNSSMMMNMIGSGLPSQLSDPPMGSQRRRNNDLFWAERLDRAPAKFTHRESIISLRRVLFQLCELHSDEAGCWLDLAKEAREAGELGHSQHALASCEELLKSGKVMGHIKCSLDCERQLLKARLFYDRGQSKMALMCLKRLSEPSDLPGLTNEMKGDIALTMASWLRQSGNAESEQVIAKYKRAQTFLSESEDCHFQLATFMDAEFRRRMQHCKLDFEVKKKQWESSSNINDDPKKKKSKSKSSHRRSSVSPSSSLVGSSSSNSSNSMMIFMEDDSNNQLRIDDVPLELLIKHGMVSLLSELMMQYMNSLRHGHSHLFQSLPRVWALWVENGAVLDYVSIQQSQGLHGYGRRLDAKRWQTEFLKWSARIPVYQWMCLLPSVTAQCLSDEKHVKCAVSEILSFCCDAYPLETFWQCSLIIASQNTANQRGESSSELLKKLRKTVHKLRMNGHSDWIREQGTIDDPSSLSRSTSSASSSSSSMMMVSKSVSLSHKWKNALDDIEHLLKEILKLVPPKKKGQATPKPNPTLQPALVDRHGWSVLVPILDNLLPTLPPRYTRKWNAFSEQGVCISHFNKKVSTMASQARPRKIGCIGTDGQCYNFLIKRENTGDMRKDQRTMEMCAVMNRLFMDDDSARDRRLRMVTYAVISVEETVGIVEWVEHVTTLRTCVGEGFRMRFEQQSDSRPSRHRSNAGDHHHNGGVASYYVSYKEKCERLRGKLNTLNGKYYNHAMSSSDLRECFIRDILAHAPKTLAHWFQVNWSHNCQAWLQARLRWTRSCALWSMVSFLLAIGDRHLENILINTRNGDFVNIDFDCLFDKAKSFAIPEQVPFRLTPNIIDSLGLTGCEGAWRRAAEVSLSVLRRHKDTLVNTLYSFVYDPLIDARAVFEHETPSSTMIPTVVSAGPTSGARELVATSKHTVRQHNRSLRVTSKSLRMQGRVALAHVTLRLDGHVYVTKMHKKTGYPCTMMDGSSAVFAVEGQVQKLIEQASDIDLLARMFHGWMPFV